ncbi:MAG: ATP-binding protein [Phycisphaerae bacterium]
MRLVRITLATKYRILFGCAVALIIGAALFVPWYQMEALLLEPLFREAQRTADDYFRLVLPHPGTPGGSAPGVHGDPFTLLPRRLEQPPRFIRIDPDPDRPDSILSAATEQPFVRESLNALRRDPKRDFYYRTATEEGRRSFYYAHAVRVAKSCLACHDEGKTAAPYRENQLAGFITVALSASQAQWDLVLNRAWIVAAGALAGILAILVFYFITQKFILAPIEELREVAIRVTDGDLTVRSAVRTGDEFEQLSNNLNTMLERLRASQEELQKANLLLDEKLGQMAETNVALFESNRLKSEFIANVSHELRTPLTSIIGFAELLLESQAGESGDRTTRFAQNILISGRILLEIINDLLDLAKIEAGRVELHLEPVSARELCSALQDFLRPLADKKSILLVVDADDDLPAIRTDRKVLRQILFNFMSNAVKFTPEGGQVRLSARATDESHVRFAVSDTGPGIAREHQDMIFEKFRQIDQSATREHAGTGLGLAISKELTHLLGGRIGVASEIGAGATFWVELPLTTSQSREREPISLV